MNRQRKKDQSEVLENALDKLKELDSELDDIKKWMNSIIYQPTKHKKVKSLAQSREISNQVAETKSKLLELNNFDNLNKAVDASEKLVRTLKSILISPYVEEVVNEFRALIASTRVEARQDLETGIRDSLKEVDEKTITELSELIRRITDKVRQVQVRVLGDQFREWFSLALQNLHEKEKRLETLRRWIEDLNSGVDKLLNLDKFMDDINKDGEALRKVSSLLAKFYGIALKSVEENFKNRKKDAPTFWDENWKKISGIWVKTKNKLVVLNSMVDSLTEAEKQLIEKHVQHLNGLVLEKFDNELDNINNWLSNIYKGKEAIDKINQHIDSVNEIDVSKTPFQSLEDKLKKLSTNIPSSDSAQTLDGYASFLKEMTREVDDWDAEFRSLRTQVREEISTWMSICERRKEKLSEFTTKLKSLMSDIDASNTLGAAVKTYLKLARLYSEIKDVLKNEVDPVILDAITKISSLKGSGKAISLSEIEDEVRRTRQDVTSEQVAVSVAKMHANNLIRVEIVVT